MKVKRKPVSLVIDWTDVVVCRMPIRVVGGNGAGDVLKPAAGRHWTGTCHRANRHATAQGRRMIQVLG